MPASQFPRHTGLLKPGASGESFPLAINSRNPRCPHTLSPSHPLLPQHSLSALSTLCWLSSYQEKWKQQEVNLTDTQEPLCSPTRLCSLCLLACFSCSCLRPPLHEDTSSSPSLPTQGCCFNQLPFLHYNISLLSSYSSVNHVANTCNYFSPLKQTKKVLSWIMSAVHLILLFTTITAIYCPMS